MPINSVMVCIYPLKEELISICWSSSLGNRAKSKQLLSQVCNNEKWHMKSQLTLMNCIKRSLLIDVKRSFSPLSLNHIYKHNHNDSTSEFFMIRHRPASSICKKNKINSFNTNIMINGKNDEKTISSSYKPIYYASLDTVN